MTAPVVGLVADDLTGAADSAVQFARDGWAPRLALGTGDTAVCGSGSGSVTAVVTDARALGDTAARAVTRAAVHDLVRDGAELIFVKIDSTMRGSVGAQVQGALEAWRVEHPDAFAVVTPAYPAMGRTVLRGTLLVDGAGVETTAVGRDPVTPVTTSDLAALVPGGVGVAVDGDDARAMARRFAAAAAASGSGVLIVDAETDDELRTVAGAVAVLGADAVPVGSAGLAVTVSQAWGEGLPRPTPGVPSSSPHVVVVMSSLHDASRGQHEHLLQAWGEGSRAGRPFVRVVAPTLDEARAGDLDAALVRSPAGPPSRDSTAGPRLTVVLAPPRADGGSTPTTSPDQDAPTDAERVAAALAALTDRVVDGHGDVALVLVGGEGARAVLRRAGADAVLVRGALREGVPWGTLEGGRLDGRPVVTKAGGFGPATTIGDVVADLLDPPSPHDRERDPS